MPIDPNTENHNPECLKSQKTKWERTIPTQKVGCIKGMEKRILESD